MKNFIGKILVVDDDATITTLLESALENHGYQVETAGDGIEGLERYKIFRPDIIILDILMPRMDGYTFVQEFKKIGNLRSTPIIILTSRDSMKEIFEIEGINDYIVKPFTMENLLRKIKKRMEAKVKKILIVDDEMEILQIIGSRLKSNGYDVVNAYNGVEALTMAKEEAPDLILLDIMMPKLDGYNVCRMLKFDSDFKDIAIVMLTALGSESDRRLGEEVGADAYITKPFDSNALLNRIKELLWD